MTQRLRTALRLLLIAVTFGFIAWSLLGQWSEVRATISGVDLRWGWIFAASLVVLATYALLIHSWRQLLAGWGDQLAFPVAIRIWTIANLGRWIPGKVWSVGALGLLAREQGVSGLAAAGAALLGTLLNIGAGFGVAALTGSAALEQLRPGLRSVTAAVAVAFTLGVLMLPLLLPPLIRQISRWRGGAAPAQPLPARVLWQATAANGLSWVGYGIAFALFAKGVGSAVSGNPLTFIALFTVSYLIGYLALFAPGGLGVREYALVALLVGLGVAGKGDAVLFSATSRVWLTVLEVLPGLVSLLWLTPAQRASLRARS